MPEVFSAINTANLIELVDGIQLLSHQRTLKIKPEIDRVIQEHRHSMIFSNKIDEEKASDTLSALTNLIDHHYKMAMLDLSLCNLHPLAY